jgi:acetyltransferase-like isoleucine patch superfamily enzyme
MTINMMRIFKSFYSRRRLERHGCKLATKVSNLGKTVTLVLEEHVKLGKIDIYGGEHSFGAYSYMRSGGELYGSTTVGRFCSIGQNVIIGLEKNKHPINWLSTSFFSKNIEKYYETLCLNNKTIVGNDCWIGRDAVIMSGVNIGNGAIIGARALVTSDVPPYAIYAGIPAKLIRYRFSAEMIERVNESRWWNTSISYLNRLKLDEPESCVNQIKFFDTVSIAQYRKFRITRQGIKFLE